MWKSIKRSAPQLNVPVLTWRGDEDGETRIEKLDFKEIWTFDNCELPKVRFWDYLPKKPKFKPEEA